MGVDTWREKHQHARSLRERETKQTSIAVMQVADRRALADIRTDWERPLRRVLGRTGALTTALTQAISRGETQCVLLWFARVHSGSTGPSSRLTANSVAVRRRVLLTPFTMRFVRPRRGHHALGAAPSPPILVGCCHRSRWTHAQSRQVSNPAASEIPPRDGHWQFFVHGTAEQRSRAERAIRIAAVRASLEAVTCHLAQSRASPLESLATEQPRCGFVVRGGLASLWSTVTAHILADTEQLAICSAPRMERTAAMWTNTLTGT